MLVFTNTIEREIDYFKALEKDKEIKMIYVAVFRQDGKKKIMIKQFPKGWLDK